MQPKTEESNFKINAKKSIFPALTGIRAFAAYSVFIFHFNPLNKSSFIGRIFNELHTGVDIFFVLSGFLISYRYLDTSEIKKKWLKQYLINRVARIYPAFFLFTFLTYLFKFFESLKSSEYTFPQVLKNNIFEFLMNITFLKGFFNDLKFIGIPQGWTLTVEECFYLSAPLIFLIIKKIKLFHLSILIIILGFFIVRYCHTFPYGFFNNNQFMLQFTFFGKVFDFFIGIFLALQLKNGQINNNSLLSNTYISFITYFILLLVISYVRTYYSTPIPAILIINFLLPINIYFILRGLITQKCVINKILSSDPSILLGKSSYIFYLIHLGIFNLLIKTYITDNLFIQFIILLILSILFYKFFEDPMNYIIRRTYANKKK